MSRRSRNGLLGSSISWRLAASLVGAAIVAIAVVVIVSIGSGGPPQSTARARIYSAFSACLLTDAHGVSGPPAKEAWAGMEQASLATQAKVSYLAVAGADTRGDVAPYVATLVVRRCNVIVTAGPAQAVAVSTDAERFGSVRFVVIGGHSTQSNVTDVNVPAGQLSSAIAGVVESAARGVPR